MQSKTTMLVLLFPLALASCSGLRLSGYRSKSADRKAVAPPVDEQFAVRSATRTAHRRLENYDLPAVSTSAVELSLFYSDLGPDRIDVSSYPARQRYNYAIYRMACSQCHTLARSINAPMVNRTYWEWYVLGMRFNAYFSQGQKLANDDVERILDFLEYDSNVRKRDHRSEFEELQEELKRRYAVVRDERIRRMQERKVSEGAANQ